MRNDYPSIRPFMSQYEKKWHEIQKIDPKDYLELFKEEADLIIIATRDLEVNQVNGITLYVRLMFYVLNLNDQFDQNIYQKNKDLLSTAIGYDVTFDEAERFAKIASKESNRISDFVEEIKSLFNRIPEEIKEDIITFCLILGCKERRPTFKVRTFLSRLY